MVRDRQRSSPLVLWLAPFVIVGGVLLFVSWASEREHSSHLPERYEHVSRGNFEVFYPPARASDMARVMSEAERFLSRTAAAYGGRLGDLSAPLAPIRVTLFGSHDEFRRFTQSAMGEDLPHNGGYFETSTLEITLVLAPEAGQVDDTRGIRHEVAHLLLARGGGRFGTQMPSWLNEGLATWLETADPAAPDRSGPLPMWVEGVAVTARPPTARWIVALPSGAFGRAGNEVAYAYSTLLVRFLVGRGPGAFWRYARAAREGRGGDWADFLSAFGPEADIEAAWADAMEARRAAWARALGEAADRKASGPTGLRLFRATP